MRFAQDVGYAPDFDNPQTFNEKIQWLKLNYRDPLMIQCADKYTVRDYVKETVGEEYLIKLLGVYDHAEDIDFDALPNKFALKASRGWNMQVICKDKKQLDTDIARRIADKWLDPKSNHYYRSYEWNYKDATPRIICEEYIEDVDSGDLKDYKFHCFNGEPKVIDACSNREEDLKIDWYDTEWNRIDMQGNHPNSETGVEKPKHLDEMLELARQLSKPFPFVRVDFYEAGGKILFGELTFTPAAGFTAFKPLEWDYRLGDMLELPSSKKNLQYAVYRLKKLFSIS
jgi:hypothetical protein